MDLNLSRLFLKSCGRIVSSQTRGF